MPARNARPVLHAVVKRLHAAPSLPYTDPVIETVEGLIPDGFLSAEDGSGEGRNSACRGPRGDLYQVGP
jgi:hypothetical protein